MVEESEKVFKFYVNKRHPSLKFEDNLENPFLPFLRFLPILRFLRFFKSFLTKDKKYEIPLKYRKKRKKEKNGKYIYYGGRE